MDRVVVEHSSIQKKLYKDIISYKLKNKIKDLPNTKINELKSSYQLKYNINSRQYNSIYLELTGKITTAPQTFDFDRRHRRCRSTGTPTRYFGPPAMIYIEL